jgi:hypothetical protein
MKRDGRTFAPFVGFDIEVEHHGTSFRDLRLYVGARRTLILSST